MESTEIILAVITAIGILLPAIIKFYGDRARESEAAADKLIDQMQEQIAELRKQQDEDRARYLAEIERLRAEIEAEKAARLEAEKAANDFRARFEQATLDRVDRIQRIRELEREVDHLTKKVRELEQRDTGELKKP